jgi:hypothetical protein
MPDLTGKVANSFRKWWQPPLGNIRTLPQRFGIVTNSNTIHFYRKNRIHIVILQIELLATSS